MNPRTAESLVAILPGIEIERSVRIAVDLRGCRAN